MQIFSEHSIIQKIVSNECFSGEIESGAFVMRIDKYVPSIYTAIHDGHSVPSDLLNSMQVSSDQRTYEEDPYTGEIADLFPIMIIVRDSRYAYDLNRHPEECIYDHAWGQKVWETSPSPAQRSTLLERHSSYYRVLHALLNNLETKYSSCVVYDLHSYNYSRINGNPPLFNIGTHYINHSLFEPVLSHLITQLSYISLDQIDNRTVCDEVFRGGGYQAQFISSKHPHCLCIPLEIKKVFMDEDTFERHSDIMSQLKNGLKEALSSSASFLIS
eukprot:GHVR01003226.1.p1 GENE.GHVR01003226.1~~GHVR01003226.1.p1  ORF type:complete len:272 (-),score=20.59 GHVR01003226.1:91-906(-)